MDYTLSSHPVASFVFENSSPLSVVKDLYENTPYILSKKLIVRMAILFLIALAKYLTNKIVNTNQDQVSFLYFANINANSPLVRLLQHIIMIYFICGTYEHTQLTSINNTLYIYL